MRTKKVDSKKVIAMAGAMAMIGSVSLTNPAQAAQDDDHWDSHINIRFRTKSRTMKDRVGDYRAIFDQRNTATSDCLGGGNSIVVTLFKDDRWWDNSQGARVLPKDCRRVDGAWWTNLGGKQTYYRITNRDRGRARGEFDSRDA